MADYTPLTEFVAKDSLSVNDPEKKVVGAELDAEFDAISTAIASKMNSGVGGVANGLAELNANAKVLPEQLWANTATLDIETGVVAVPTDLSNSFYLELLENVTISAPVDPVNGQTIWFLIKQDGTGGWTVTWNAAYRFAGGSAPTMTATAAKADLYVATYNSTLAVWIVVAHQNFTVV
jgi:hypothetical protein